MIRLVNSRYYIGALLTVLGAAILLALSSCKSAPPRAPAPTPSPVAPAPSPAVPVSNAGDERAYRQDAARHMYAQHSSKVFKGKLPPNLPGVGVVDVAVDARGNVASITWVRRPSDLRFVPITEQLIRTAAPFPAPARLGGRVALDCRREVSARYADRRPAPRLSNG
jgi:periplasmic protein TonB